MARLELAGILFPPDAKPGCDSRFWYDELRFLPIVEISPNLLSGISILAAYVIFGGSYLVFALGKFPGLKIDRPAAAIIGAVAMTYYLPSNPVQDAKNASGGSYHSDGRMLVVFLN